MEKELIEIGAILWLEYRSKVGISTLEPTEAQILPPALTTLPQSSIMENSPALTSQLRLHKTKKQSVIPFMVQS